MISSFQALIPINYECSLAIEKPISKIFERPLECLANPAFTFSNKLELGDVPLLKPIAKRSKPLETPQITSFDTTLEEMDRNAEKVIQQSSVLCFLDQTGLHLPVIDCDVLDQTRTIGSFFLDKLTISNSPDHETAVASLPEKKKNEVNPLQAKLRASLAAHKYYYLGKLGNGVFGTVYKVIKKTQRTAAQFFAAKISNPNEVAVLAQKNEERIVRHLNVKDPLSRGNIVQLYDGFKLNASHCTVYEYLPNNLLNILRKSPSKTLSLKQVRIVAKQLFESLAFLSQEKIVHTDLKPENIVVTSHDELKLRVIDFGSAFFIGEKHDLHVQTIYYRSPEVAARCKRLYTPQIDMWSVGCILAELFTGAPIFFASEMDSVENENLNLLTTIAKVLGTAPDCITEGRLFKNRDGKAINKKALHSITKLKTNQLAPYIFKLVDEPSFKTLEYIHFIDLLEKTLAFDPAQRIKPDVALTHPFLTDFVTPVIDLFRQDLSSYGIAAAAASEP